MRSVEGKVAFVSGGSSGIGLGITRAFVAAGMRVAFGYLTESHREAAYEVLAGSHDRVHALRVDVTDREAMGRAGRQTVERFGRVHVLVNNAGMGTRTPLSAPGFAEWDWALSVNVTGVFNGIQSFLPHLRSHGEGGHIVTTASMAGLFVAATAGIYSTTKFAVVGMMEALRAELRGSGIGVSVFCPGLVNSNIHAASRNHPAQSQDDRPLAARDTPGVSEDQAARPGMDPLEAGEWVLRGILEDQLYILTHPEFATGIRDRNEALMASLPAGVAAPPDRRIEAERAVLRNRIYQDVCSRANLRR